MLALSNKLLKDFETIFIKKELINIDDRMQKFIKYLHLPILISTHQDNKYKNPQIAKQGGNLFKIVNKNDDSELVKATKLKVMLSTSNTSTSFTEVDISSNKLSPNFSATYKVGENRDSAKEHIKALLKDGNKIEIYDRYLSSIDSSNGYDVWINKNLALLKAILPQKNINVDIYCEYNWNNNRERDLKNLCGDWNVVKQNWDYNIHDRYIITDKVEILLSSGLSNLDNSSSKDFSYIVRIK